jgi:hypothetical protein
MTMTKREILRSFPEARAALKAGTDWEYRPECVDQLLYCPTLDDDGKYQDFWWGFGYAIEKGVVYVTEHTCDACGDWDTTEWHEATAANVRRLRREYADALEQACEAEAVMREERRVECEAEAARSAVQQNLERACMDAVERHTRGLLQRDVERLCEAIEAAGLPTTYRDMTPDNVRDIVRLTLNWRKANPPEPGELTVKYPDSKSATARPARYEIHSNVGVLMAGTVLLSTTQPRRALRRLLAAMRKQFPNLNHYTAEFV